MNIETLNPKLKQRGRAEIDFMISMFSGSKNVRQMSEADINAAAGDIDALPDDMDARTEKILPKLSE